MANAARLAWTIQIPNIDTAVLNRFEWRNAYEKVSEERLRKSAALAINAPTLKPVVAKHYVIQGRVAEELTIQLPPRLLKLEIPVVVYTVFESDGPSQLIIHKDWGRRTVINVYETAGDAVTTFYTHDKTTNFVRTLDSFCAVSGEVWVMNSKVYHGVIFDTPLKRTMINFAFRRLSLNDIVESAH